MSVYRILDANYNRAAEGLRVVEEFLRFSLEDRHLAEQYKIVRHALSDLRSTFANALIAERDTPHDVGTQIETEQEHARHDLRHVAAASQARVEQALRCIEEYGKVATHPPTHEVEALRYRLYQLGQAWQVSLAACERMRNKKLYVLLNGCSSEANFRKTATTVVAGGADIIQFRDKQLSDRALLKRGKLLRELCAPDCLFIMNDRPDLAVLCAADGIHVGQDELPVHAVRRIVGPNLLIGVSTHSLQDARQAGLDGADYIGCGPVFPSETKHFASHVGLSLLKEVADDVSLPAFAIGGITRLNVKEVLNTGFHRVAVSNAVLNASDPGAATRELKSILIGASE